MATRKRMKCADNQEVILILTRIEVSQLLGILSHAEGVVNLVDPKEFENFFGKLIKKLGKALTKSK